MNYQAATGPLVPSAPLPVTSDMDKMFSDLGLDTFVSKTAGDTTGTNGQSKSSITPSVSAGSLTLEDKQRMVRQQEQAQRLQNTPDLVASRPMAAPFSAPPAAAPQKPIDLTSKLMDSNLNQIKSPTGNNNSSSNWMTSPTAASAAAPPSSSGESNWGAMTSSTSGSNWNANFSGFNAMQSAAPASTMMPQQWAGSTTTKPSSQSNGTNNNWSALDNLLPAKQKTPINQMSGGQQPLLMSHSQPMQGSGNNNKQQQGGGANQLSQQDIMEFLG